MNEVHNYQLHNHDFLRNWQSVQDHSVDLILTDPPYGAITDAQPWDVRPDFHVLAWQFSKLLKPNGQIVIFADFHTAIDIQCAFEKYFSFRFQWIWQKPSVIPRNYSRPANDIELILVYKHNAAKKNDLTFNVDEIREPGQPFTRKAGKSQNENPTLKGGGNMPEQYENETGGRFPRSVLQFPNKPCMTKAERTAHPTQKPLELVNYILKALTNPGDLILDPFLGSGTTVVAASKMNRRSIGFELKPEYFEMANKRIMHESAQGVLL